MRSFILSVLPFLLLTFFAQAQFSASIESGLVFSGYNDVRIPNGADDNSTLFSLKDDFTPKQPVVFIRAELSYLLNDKHTFELTAAPLQLEYTNAQLNSINFAGTTFTGENINGTYKFNTYRLSYRYRLVDKPKLSIDLGATALLRDAQIALMQNSTQADKSNLGIVPLVSFALNYAPNSNISLLLKGDALASPQGRAEDIFAGILYKLNEHLKLKAGYRMIEGGSDGSTVYGFALIHFADVGLTYSFGTPSL